MYDNRTENNAIGRIDGATKRQMRTYGTVPDCRSCKFARVKYDGTVACAQDRWTFKGADMMYVYRNINAFMRSRRRQAETCGDFDDMREDPK